LHVTRAIGVAQWLDGASVQGTGVGGTGVEPACFRGILLSLFPLEDSNGRAAEIRNPFCRNDPGSTETQRECAIADAIENAKHILEKIDERWPKEHVKPFD